MSAIPPYQLCFLSDLPAKAPGDKVRFLGCVTSYDTAAAVLTLQHEHPPAARRESRVRARVNVDLVLERLTAEQVSVGAWVNVIGYVAAPAPTDPAPPPAPAATDVRLQALLLWPAGPLNLQTYERQLAAMLP